MTRKSSSKLIKNINAAHTEDWKGLSEELQNGTDRATAILGGVFLDERLKELLVSFVVEDRTIIENLFGPEKPLSTFSAKITTAYALGLINRETFDDLTKIRYIRNAFAHALHGISFTHEDVDRWCKDLATPKQVIPSDLDKFIPRMLYITATLSISSYLQIKTEYAKQHRCEVPKDSVHIQWTSVGNPEEIVPSEPYIIAEKEGTRMSD